MKKIIVIGGGFAGLNVVRALQKMPVEILVIDKLNYHQFQPLFYQVATARLEASSISFPLRKIFQQYKNVHFRLATVKTIDTAQQKVLCDVGAYDYDELIIAAGCTTSFFGNEEIEKYALPMKSIPEALALRNQILSNFEQALEVQPENLKPYMNIVVVGGGPTGVELAGALAEMKNNILPKDYPDMDFSALEIYLLEGGPHLLGPMSDASHHHSKIYLEQLGVKVRTETIVKNYDGATVYLANGDEIQTRQLIWAAGVQGNTFAGLPEFTKARGNRIIVDRFNQVKGLENVYAIGDIAYMETPLYPKGHPQVANVANGQGKLLGKNLCKSSKNSWQEYEYKDQGSMATVGKKKAVVDLPKMSFQGRFAWFFWMFLHLMLILSVRNKLMIFINWMIGYFTNDSSLRLIIAPSKKQGRESKPKNDLVSV